MHEATDEPPNPFSLCGFTFIPLAWMRWAWRAYWRALVIVPLLWAAVNVVAEFQRPPNAGLPRWAQIEAYTLLFAVFSALGIYGFVMFTGIAWMGWARPHRLSIVRTLAVWGTWAILTVGEATALVLVALAVWIIFGARL